MVTEIHQRAVDTNGFRVRRVRTPALFVAGEPVKPDSVNSAAIRVPEERPAEGSAAPMRSLAAL